jgi:hypothetical protein
MNRFQLRRIGVASEQADARPTLRDCLESVIPVADGLMRDVLNGLASFGAGQKYYSAFAGPMPVSKEMTDRLCCQAPVVTETFVTQLKLGIYSSQSQEFIDRLTAPAVDLQLLSNEQIDAGIEFALALQEVSRCVDDALAPLDALISGLSGWVTVQPMLNPLKAEVFVHAMLVCLRRHVPDQTARTALLVPCAGLLGVSLRQLYSEICAWLRSHGVEPAWPAGTCFGGGNSALEKGLNNSVSRTLALLGKLQKLLSGPAESGDHGSAEPDFLPTVPFSCVALEDLKLMGPMMRRLAQRGKQVLDAAATPDAPAQGISVELISVRQSSRQLDQEVVHLMLDHLMQDERLLPAVRDLISRMEPALLLLAGTDPRFFSHRQHPARQLLEWLIGRSLGYRSENDPLFQRFFASAKGAVMALKARDGDAALFAAVLRKLQADWRWDEMTRPQSDDFEPRQFDDRNQPWVAQT